MPLMIRPPPSHSSYTIAHNDISFHGCRLERKEEETDSQKGAQKRDEMRMESLAVCSGISIMVDRRERKEE